MAFSQPYMVGMPPDAYAMQHMQMQQHMAMQTPPPMGSTMSQMSHGPGIPMQQVHSMASQGSSPQRSPNQNTPGSNLYSERSSMSSQSSESQGSQAGVPEGTITDFKMPEWVDMVLAITGIQDLQYKIGEERAKREAEEYINPYPFVNQLVASMRFEVGIACVIVLNCILIGWEASVDPGTLEDFFSVMEHLFVITFVIEWCLRMLAFGWVWMWELTNFADTILVFGTGVLPKWIMEPTGRDISFLRIFTVLRVLRLARLAKSVRLIPFFKELWILIHGLTTSARPLLWTFVIALIILYCFAVAATELIGRSDNFEDDEYVQERFGNLLRSMFTMFQLMTLDTWGFEVARPVMDTEFSFWIFFVTFIGLGVFVFWNLITAIIVENALSIAKEDSAHQAKEVENAKKRELKALADLFLEIDTDGSGELTTQEFFGALEDNKKVQQQIALLELKKEELTDVWETLDDGDGLLTIKEFTNGIRRMKGEAKAKDIIDAVKRLRHTSLAHTELRAQVEQFGGTLRNLEGDISRISNDTAEVLGLFHEMYHRLGVHVERTDKANRTKAIQREKAARLAEAQGDEAEESATVED